MIIKLHNKEFTAHTCRPFSFLAMIILKAETMQNSESKQFITGNSQNTKTLHSSNNEFGLVSLSWNLEVWMLEILPLQRDKLKCCTEDHLTEQSSLSKISHFFIRMTWGCYFLVPGLSLSWIWSFKFELFSKMMKKEIDLYDYFRQTYLFQSVSKETELPALLLVPFGHEFFLRLLSKFCRPETFLPKLALRK